VVFDTLSRLLRHQFPDADVIYARNVTDVDDKIIASAAAEGVETSVITERFERFYLSDMGALGVAPPTLAPHATADIGPMVAMIAGARVEVAPYKRDAADFVLWKPSSDDVIGWDSPWGRGRPGWHIECSAMIAAHLGETIDIHGGGLDLIFPHHENEIAQSRCAHGGKPLANYWVHNGFVDMGAEKMSKSLGNVITVDRLLADGHRGEVLRLALLSGHYRSPLPWTESLIAQSRATLDGLYRAAADAEAGAVDEGVIEALSDDLNTPLAMARLGALDDPSVLKASAQLFGLLGNSAEEWFQGPRIVQMSGSGTTRLSASATLTVARDRDSIEALIAQRAEAKARREFAEADRIRAELADEGVLLEDGPGGTTWRRA
jgi:cysteinyl-tRNA synthetase